MEAIECDQKRADTGRKPQKTMLREGVRLEHAVFHGTNSFLFLDVVAVQGGQIKVGGSG